MDGSIPETYWVGIWMPITMATRLLLPVVLAMLNRSVSLLLFEGTAALLHIG